MSVPASFDAEGAPSFEIAIQGTAPISRVTLVRNEQDYQVYEPNTESKEFTRSCTDETPVKGGNRYYVRIEQGDGNMGWTSPVWVTVK